jgi:transposase
VQRGYFFASPYHILRDGSATATSASTTSTGWPRTGSPATACTASSSSVITSRWPRPPVSGTRVASGWGPLSGEAQSTTCWRTTSPCCWSTPRRSSTGQGVRDTIEAAWLAQLCAHGLLTASFVPPPPVRELRDLTRYRKALVHDHTRQVNRIRQGARGAGIKLSSFATDVMGVSGRAMMRALIAGRDDPAAMAELAKGRMRPKIPQLRKALTGRFRDHHAFLLDRMLAHAESQEADIAVLDARIEAALAPFAAEAALLRTIPGMDRRSAEVVLAEIGPDMAVFPTAAQLASWAGMCPGQRDSAGKRGSGKTRKGSRWLRAALVQSARATARSKGTYLAERYRQVMRRRGDAKAIIAVGHEILLAAHRVLATGQPYTDPGPIALRSLTADLQRRRAVRRLEEVGYEVTIEPTERAG